MTTSSDGVRCDQVDVGDGSGAAEGLFLGLVLVLREMLDNRCKSSRRSRNGDRRDEIFLHLVSFGLRGGIGGFHQKRVSCGRLGSWITQLPFLQQLIAL